LPLLAAVVLSLATALVYLPPFPAPTETVVRTPRWDLPARVLVAAGVVVALSAAATRIGARPTGLLAVYPLYSAVLAAFAHRLQGGRAAVGLLRGLLVGLFSFAAFYSTLALLLVHAGTATAFVGAAVAALLVQSGSLGRVRVRSAASPSG